jgi:hypothetical protein
VKTLLFFAIPPLAGALIGFVTNVIAIKMLFRPLREIQVWGIRLPFTPGILPRQRHKLAASIGAMVERELLTPELLRRRLGREDVRVKARESLSRFTAKLLDRPLGDFCDPARMNQSLFELLGMPALEDRIADWVRAGLRSHAGRVTGELERAAAEFYPGMAAALGAFLRRADVHRELEIHGWIFLNKAIRKLNMFQRFVISAARYDQTLDEQMPEIIDDLIGQMEGLAGDQKIRERVLSAAGAALGRLFSGEHPPLVPLITGLVRAELGKPLGELLPALGLRADVPLGTLFAVDAAKKEKLDEALCSRLLRIADEQIEQVLASVDVRTLVSERIDSLEMIRVERIILDVMANQLKWIDVFGAILGLFIGLFQVLCSWLFR